MIVFSKIFQNLFSPLPVFLVVLAVGIWMIERNRRVAKRLLVTGFLFIFMLSNRHVSGYLMNSIESDFPPRPIPSIPETDAAVVLGGSLSSLVNGRIGLEENGGSRLVSAFQIFRMGKIRKIVVSGGNPYIGPTGQLRTEADDMEAFLISLGTPAEVIVKENRSRNTEENSIEIAKVLNERNWKAPILITSAFHMRRAVYFFKASGVIPLPLAVGHKAMSDPRFWYLFWVPSVSALEMSSQAIKEHFGCWWAWIKVSVK